MMRFTLLLSIILLLCISCDQKRQTEESIKTKESKEIKVEIPKDGPSGMVWITGDQFTMGALENDSYARTDEKPAHEVKVSGFWMDINEVTNSEFRKFIEATGYVTTAEKKPDWEELKKQVPPGTPKPHDSMLVAASMVFTPVDTDNLFDWSQWWSWVKGANWQHPQGPESSIEGKEDHPVVQVSWDDAQAYLNWVGKRFPTDAEWEFAARGGLQNKLYPWGNDTNISAFGNTWQGTFPLYNSLKDGYFTTAPVRTYQPNGYGLYDMAGNVWEWTSDWYNVTYYKESADQGVIEDPKGADKPFDPRQPYTPQRIQRGGSFLCNNSYCSSYRASARMHSSQDTSQDHVGFRGVMTQEQWEVLKNKQ
ncbi:formylglycine-generating enzyme family protein [Aquimarina algiphila]|uniref:formylglycine-generating enzyme family protein n=1 Tax=Aquimarina algiphila TaxID=2047982 RepID=UPI0023307D61|nr:formylglycine-generating enzyme family protein [Aquimarina algiphila]